MRRRNFLQNTLKGVTIGLTAPYILSSCKRNDLVNVGFLGVGGRGSGLLKQFMLLRDIQIIGIYLAQIMHFDLCK